MSVLGRVTTHVFGIFLMSLGVSLTIISGLGTTPISSLPVVVSAIGGLTVGTVTVLMNLVFVLVQIALLRRRYRPVQILQLLGGFLFGLLIDATTFALTAVSLDPGNYLQQWLLALAGIVSMGVGVGFQVQPQLINLPGEGLVLALTAELRRVVGPRRRLTFGTVKTLNDAAMLIIAVVLSLTFLGELVGVREGTVAAAFLLGYIAQATLRVLPESDRQSTPG